MEGGKCKHCAEKIENPAESNNSQDKALVTDVLVEKKVSSEAMVLLDNEEKESENKENLAESNNSQDKALVTDVLVEKEVSSESVVLLDNEEKESDNKENPAESNNSEDKALETDVPVEKNRSLEPAVLLDNEEKESEKSKPDGEKGGKESEDKKKVDHEPKPSSDTPEKPAAQSEDKTVEKSSKTKTAPIKDPSPLATFFKDWDKFTPGQKKEIERFIRKKAEEVRAAGGKVRPAGWREQHPHRNSHRRDNARRFDSPRRITRPVSRWATRRERGGSLLAGRRPEPWGLTSQGQSSRTVDHLLMKRVQDFIRLVSAIPVVNYVPRQPLLPTPPLGYQTAARITGHYDMKNEDSSQRYAEKSFIIPQPRPLLTTQQYTVKTEDVPRRPTFKFFPPSPSKRASRVRMSPYRPPGTRTVLGWSDRQRTYPDSTKIAAHFDDPFKDKRFISNSNNSAYKR